MRVYLSKFGNRLTSREAGREAALAFKSQSIDLKPESDLTLDFEGIEVLNPSWADEFINPLLDEYKERVKFVNTGNPSVKTTLEFLSSNIWGKKLILSDHEETKSYKNWLLTPIVFENTGTGGYVVTVQLRKQNEDGSLTISSLEFKDPFYTKEEAVAKSYEMATRALDQRI